MRINKLKKIFNIKFEILLIFFFLISLWKFNNLTPQIDQSFHIFWIEKIISSDFNFKNNFNYLLYLFTNLGNLAQISISDFQKLPDIHFYENNLLLNNLIKVMASPFNYFSYYFHIVFVLIASIVFKIFFFNNFFWIFNFFSIFFSTLNILISFKIFKFIIKEIKIEYKKYYLLIFVLIFTSYYFFYFSALGIHNFASFMFLLTIYFLIKIITNITLKKIFFIGCLTSISILSHQSNLILLVVPISITILFLNEKITKKAILLFFFSIPLILTLVPYFFLLTHFKTTNSSGPFILNLNLFRIYFENLILLLGPVCFPSLLFFYYEKIRKNFSCKILMIFIIYHFILFIFWELLEKTYIRNFLYISYLYLILSTILIIYTIERINFKEKKKKFKKILLFFLFINFIYNVSIIYSFNNLKNKNSFFYQKYFLKNNRIPEINKKILFFLDKQDYEYYLFYNNQNTANYTLIYNNKIYNKNLINKKPIQSYNDLNFFIQKNKNIPEFIDSIFIISIIELKNQIIINTILHKILENFSKKKDCNFVKINILAEEFTLVGKNHIYLLDQIKCSNK